jgi:phosphate transport system substrate-binding protein
VGLIIFTLVVNSKTSVFKLTTAQLHQIFSGTISNWQQLDGPNLPISIISRYPGSGSRTAFDDKILGGSEPQVSSYDCIHKNAVSASPVILCEEPTTSNLLQTVAAVPGAIGYAETGDVENFAGGAIEPVELDGLSGNPGSIGTSPNSYHFWTIEYLYTYGTPAPESLANSFIKYAIGSSAAQNALRKSGYTPCGGNPQSVTASLCGSSRSG